jgi:hypothetical protein
MAFVIASVVLSPSGAFSTCNLPADPADPMVDDPTLRFLGVTTFHGRQAASGNKYVAYFGYDDATPLIERSIQQAPVSDPSAATVFSALGTYLPDEADEPFFLWFRS